MNIIIEWFKNLFRSEPIPDRDVNVGRVTATVTCNDGTKYEREFVGSYIAQMPPFISTGEWSDLISSGWNQFTDWEERNGETGCVSVSNSVRVPLCNVKHIEVKSHEHMYTVVANKEKIV